MPIGIDELSGFAKDVQSLPLVFEPGEKWQYGVGPSFNMIQFHAHTAV